MKENLAPDRAGLGLFCDRIIEAGWVVLVAVVPIFFDVYSHRSFEPDKVALMRSIALVMMLAWVIKVLEAGSWRLELEGWRSKGHVRYPISNLRSLITGTPLVLPALLLSIVYILTTITSIAPRLSLWGSYHRMQGTYTTLSYVAVFLLILHTLRKRTQLHRLITVILLTSLPISLYGIMQHYGLDPIAWTNIGDEVTVRAISTMGNPIFVAAYLMMIVPLTLGRLMQLYSVIRRGKRAASLYVLSGCYAFLLAIQLLCLLFTQSRGPLLGLMAGAFFFSLIWAAFRGEKRLALAIFGIAAILALFLVASNLPGTPFESTRGMPYLGRLGGILDFHSRTARQRALAWEGAADLIAANPQRALIGYGPETMIAALTPYLPSELASLKPGETFDRSHNETLDIWATTGLIGLAAYLLFFGSLFYHSLKYLGLISGSRQRNLFVFLCLAGGIAGGALPWLLEGRWKLAGIGIPLGILAALAVYLLTRVFLHQEEQDQRPQNPLMVMALLSAIIAHFIEIQLGISVVATRAYFWVYAALTIVIASHRQGDPSSARRPSIPRPDHTQGTSLVSYSLLVGLVLATMSFALLGSQVNSGGEVWALLGLFITVWLICIAIAIVEAGEGTASLADSIKSAPLLVSLGWFVAFLIGHIFAWRADEATALIFYHLFLLLTMVVISIVLLKAMLPAFRFQPGIRWWPYPVLIVGASVVVIVTNLNPVVADIRYKQGLAYADSGQWDTSGALFQQALKLAPNQDFYYLFLAGAWVEKAKAASDVTESSAWLEQAQEALEKGRQINPFNPDNVSKLGLLYRVWGEMLVDPREKAEKFDQSAEYYRQAEALRPHDPSIFNEWGLVYFVQGEYDEAIDKYQISSSLNPKSTQTYFLLSDAYAARGDFDQAIEAYERIIEITPDDFTAYRNLALLYEHKERIEEAIAEAEIARSLAPVNEAAELDEIIVRLRSQE